MHYSHQFPISIGQFSNSSKISKISRMHYILFADSKDALTREIVKVTLGFQPQSPWIQYPSVEYKNKNNLHYKRIDFAGKLYFFIKITLKAIVLEY